MKEDPSVTRVPLTSCKPLRLLICRVALFKTSSEESSSKMIALLLLEVGAYSKVTLSSMINLDPEWIRRCEPLNLKSLFRPLTITLPAIYNDPYEKL